MSSYCYKTLVGNLGAIQIGADYQAISFDMMSRHYDKAGYLRLDHSFIRMPLAEAHELSGLLAQAIGAAEEVEPRQTDLWDHTRLFHQVLA